jgi:UDP-glucose 4-epimerase
MQTVSGIQAQIDYAPERPGDVRDSLADITAARHEFGFEPNVSLEAGLREYMDWARGEQGEAP